MGISDRKKLPQIFVVDDNNENIQQVKNHLQDLDFTVNVTNDPRKILELAGETVPDLILMNPEYLIELEKTNALKDKMLSMIGHDLRSPLGSIKMVLDFIDQKIIDPKSQEFESTIPELIAATDEALHLLENLLYWSRIQAGTVSCEPENYKLKLLIDKALNNLKRIFNRKTITVINRISSEQSVFGDEYLLLTIFRNILSNACKFSLPGSETVIECKDSGGTIEILFRDQGIGMKEENLQKIFNPHTLFHTYGTNNETGNGLGLKVCSELTKINKGCIDLTSQEGSGTTVKLLLPSKKTDQTES